ncbi:MAG: HD-GYP domain-containing protein [Gaiellales bacterium]
MPRLDEPLEPLRLTAGGASVDLDTLAAGAPVVLALLESELEPGPRLDMLRELGRRLQGSGAQLVVVTASESAIARTLEAEALALCMTDPAAFAALGLVERGIGRVRRRGGVFVVDGAGILRFAYVAERDNDWVPCKFVVGRLQRLGIAADGAVAAPAPTSPELPEPQALSDEEESAIEILAGRVGAEMGMSAEGLKDLATAAKFRDLGMTTVPDEIITKLGPLTDEEWAIVHGHPQRSAEMLGAGPAFDRARAIIRANHEHLDGTGYPNGLAGAEIPTGSRILLVVESYVAMTEDRPYRNNLGANAAIEHLEQHAGLVYDPDAVSALARVLRHRRMSAAA